MPFYEYECSACKFYVEALQKISDPPMLKCPSCRKDTLQRLISAPVFRLKGAGWYETDFKSDKENKRNLADGADDKEPAAAAESDDKPTKVRASKVAKAAKKSARKTAAKKVVKKVVKVAGKKASSKRSKLKATPKTKSKAPAKKKTGAKPTRKAKALKKKAAKAPARKK